MSPRSAREAAGALRAEMQYFVKPGDQLELPFQLPDVRFDEGHLLAELTLLQRSSQ